MSERISMHWLKIFSGAPPDGGRVVRTRLSVTTAMTLLGERGSHLFEGFVQGGAETN